MPVSPDDRARAAAAREVYSVTRVNREVRALLERGLGVLWVEGELSNLSQPASGHWYFSLKDRDAQLRCAIDRKSTRLNSSHSQISYAVFCLKKKKKKKRQRTPHIT